MAPIFTNFTFLIHIFCSQFLSFKNFSDWKKTFPIFFPIHSKKNYPIKMIANYEILINTSLIILIKVSNYNFESVKNETQSKGSIFDLNPNNFRSNPNTRLLFLEPRDGALFPQLVSLTTGDFKK